MSPWSDRRRRPLPQRAGATEHGCAPVASLSERRRQQLMMRVRRSDPHFVPARREGDSSR